MIDLTASESRGRATLAKVAVKRDGTTGGGLIYDLTLEFPVLDPMDADIVERLLRGSRAMYDQLREAEEAKAKMESVPGGTRGRLELATDSGTPMLGTSCEIRKVILAVNPRLCVLSIQARLAGLGHHAAATLVQSLGDKVDAGWRAEQPGLPLSMRVHDPRIVEVVTARGAEDEYLFGVVTGKDEGILILDDFGDHHEVHESRVTSRVTFASPDGSQEPVLQVLAPVVDRVTSAGGKMSWAHVVLGVAQTRGAEPTGVYRLDEEDLEAARAAAMEAVVH